MKLQHCDQPLMECSDAPGVERQFFPPAVADPKHDRVAAKVQRQREGPSAAGLSRQDSQPSRIGLESNVPTVIEPWRMGNSELAEHLRGKVQDGESLVISFGAQLGPVVHDVPPLHFAVRHC